MLKIIVNRRSNDPKVLEERKRKRATKKVYNVHDMYNTFIQTSNISITKEEYIKICKEANEELFKMIVHKGYQLKIRKGLGVIFIKKVYKPNYKRLDYQHYKKTGEKQFLTPINNDGYIYKTNWLRNLILPNVRSYMFRFSKENRQYIKNAIFDGTIKITQKYKTPRKFNLESNDK
jgi:hypothetical protein